MSAPVGRNAGSFKCVRFVINPVNAITQSPGTFSRGFTVVGLSDRIIIKQSLLIDKCKIFALTYALLD